MSRRLLDETAMTLAEVLVAMLLLVVGLGATLAALPSSSKQTLTGQREEQAAAMAERELEAMRSKGYAALALSALPVATGDGLSAGDPDTDNPRLPDFYVNGTRLRIKQNFHRASSAALAGTPAAGEDIVVAAGGLAHSSTTVVDGRVWTIYRYVTQRNELCPPTFGTDVLDTVSAGVTGLLGSLLGLVNSLVPANVNVLCTGAGEKRLIVAVVPPVAGNGARITRPVYLSTVVADPKLGLTGLSG